jgi:hypothetical protein
VQPLREKSLFWQGLWIDCDRPRLGIVADCMRRTGAAYHQAIRQVKRHDESIVRQRVANSFLDNDGRDFLADGKRIHGNLSGTARI